ncbi:unnamed protein product [Urochloa humidicola]
METPTAGDDRLSELPDCVLTNNVLSRLTSLQAARTSALSRRWRHLWRAVPCVDIDQREFRASEAIDVNLASAEKARISVEESEAFEDLGERLLPLLDAAPPLDTVRLRVSCTGFRTAGRRLARRGLARRPVEFHLRCDNDCVPYADFDDSFPYFPGLTLPRHLGAFACRLTTMRLAGLSLGGDFAGCLAADFPVLEDLRLEGCKYDFRRLASRSLRKLFIDDSCLREYIHNDALAIAAPRLASLRIDCFRTPPVAVVGEMLEDLVAASLETPAGDRGLLRSLRHARSLHLSRFTATAPLLGGEDDDFPVFANLRNLVLDRCDVGVECQVLRRFLRNAPGLETLKLRDCALWGGSRSRKRKTSASASDWSHWCGPTAYECMNLKSIELQFYDDDAVDELAQALVGISKEEARPMETSVQGRRRRVKISYG